MRFEIYRQYKDKETEELKMRIQELNSEDVLCLYQDQYGISLLLNNGSLVKCYHDSVERLSEIIS